MVIDKTQFSHMLLTAATLLKKESSLLGQIDSRFGDGDHGVTITKIARLIEKKVANWHDASLHSFIEDLGNAIMEIGGGSAGPLYGALIGGMAEPLSGHDKIDALLLKAMIAGSLDALYALSKARIGDKTMMDALIPAVEAAQNAPNDITAILNAAEKAAADGAKASENFVAKFGRAKNYKEQTIGVPDAGAVSTSLLFQGLAEGMRGSAV